MVGLFWILHLACAKMMQWIRFSLTNQRSALF